MSGESWDPFDLSFAEDLDTLLGLSTEPVSGDEAPVIQAPAVQVPIEKPTYVVPQAPKAREGRRPEKPTDDLAAELAALEATYDAQDADEADIVDAEIIEETPATDVPVVQPVVQAVVAPVLEHVAAQDDDWFDPEETVGDFDFDPLPAVVTEDPFAALETAPAAAQAVDQPAEQPVEEPLADVLPFVTQVHASVEPVRVEVGTADAVVAEIKAPTPAGKILVKGVGVEWWDDAALYVDGPKRAALPNVTPTAGVPTGAKPQRLLVPTSYRLTESGMFYATWWPPGSDEQTIRSRVRPQYSENGPWFGIARIDTKAGTGWLEITTRSGVPADTVRLPPTPAGIKVAQAPAEFLTGMIYDSGDLQAHVGIVWVDDTGRVFTGPTVAFSTTLGESVDKAIGRWWHDPTIGLAHGAGLTAAHREAAIEKLYGRDDVQLASTDEIREQAAG